MSSIFTNLIFPNPAILMGIAILAAFDLLTGIYKSKKKGIATASQGFDKTINKAITYLSLIVLSFVVTNVAPHAYDLDKNIHHIEFGFDTVCFFLLYRELKSILENLIVANTNCDGIHNDIALFLIPIHNALIFKFNKEFNYHETKKDIIKKINK